VLGASADRSGLSDFNCHSPGQALAHPLRSPRLPNF
jgi:hypothetical protein